MLIHIKRFLTVLAFSAGMAACSDVPSAPERLPNEPLSAPRNLSPLSVYIEEDWYSGGDGWFYWSAYPYGGDGTYTYLWQTSRTGPSSDPEVPRRWFDGTGGSTYSRHGLFFGFYLRVIVTSGGVSATSNEIYVPGTIS